MTLPIKLAALTLFLGASGVSAGQYFAAEHPGASPTVSRANPSPADTHTIRTAYIETARKNDPIKLHALSTQTSNLSERKSPNVDKVVVDYALTELRDHKSNLGSMRKAEIDIAISSALDFLDTANRQDAALCSGKSYSVVIGAKQKEIEAYVLDLIRQDEDLHAPFLAAMTRFNAVYDPQTPYTGAAKSLNSADLSALQRRASSFVIKKDVLAIGAMYSAQQTPENILRRTNVCTIATHVLSEAQALPYQTQMKFAQRLEADDGVRQLARELRQTDFKLQF